MKSKQKFSKDKNLETKEKFREELLNKNGAISSVVPGQSGKGLFGAKPSGDSSDEEDDIKYIAM